jgi:hypothetical protein
MLSADSTTPLAAAQALYESDDERTPAISLAEVLIWLGEKKALIGAVTVGVAVISAVVALLLPPVYTARTTFLAPGSQQQSGSSAALAALGSLGALPSGLAAKAPDDLYVALLKATAFNTASTSASTCGRTTTSTPTGLRRSPPNHVRVTSDKKSGVITVEVDVGRSSPPTRQRAEPG